MTEDGYYYYKRFFEAPPQLCIEWHDTETEAEGWLILNSLRNGAAGGGTRMRDGATKEECLFLAKTMEVKFGISGPNIGGAKSVINFDPQDPRKEGVLRRWFTAIGPYLQTCYGTGGDLGVDEIREVIPLTRAILNLKHPQEGVVRGHVKPDEVRLRNILSQLGYGVGLAVPFENDPEGPFTVADMITGYGLTRALHYFYESHGDSLVGKRILVEGFGAVGGSAAYYLEQAGAKVVGILSLAGRFGGGFRWAVDHDGLNTGDLLRHREGANLPSYCPRGINASEFWNISADVFVPAAASHTITEARLEQLLNCGVKVIACGANNPFYLDWDVADMRKIVDHTLSIQREADRRFSIIPDFIANCGMARVFAYLMNEGLPMDSASIFADIDKTIQTAMEKLFDDYGDDFGILSRAYSLFVPHESELKNDRTIKIF
jgi:glutamate dehydrogenase/leucine dehydrogenase